MRIHQLQGDIDFVGAGGRPLDADLTPGRSHAVGWGLPEAVPFEAPGPGGFLFLDCVHMLSGGEFALLSERAVTVLSPLFSDCGEFLPVSLLGRCYWWFNCLVSHDCFDDAGRMFDWAAPDRFFFEPVPVWPFDAGRLAGAPSVFRVPQVPVSEVFVRDEVARSVAAGGLVGFDLRLVWPDGGGGSGVIAEREDLGLEKRERLILAKRFAMAGILETRR